MRGRSSLLLGLSAFLIALGVTRGQDNPPTPGQVPAGADPVPAAAPNPGNAPQEDAGPGPDPIPEYRLPALSTVPVRRGNPGYNWISAEAMALPKDKEGIWVLEFAYKPVRMIEVEIPNKGRRRVYYLYYRIVNRSGKPRLLVPQFSLIDDLGRRYEDVVVPLAVKKIQAKEDPATPLLGAVQMVGEIPPSTKEGIDDAVYGVAIWPEIDHKADGFQIFVRGLSDAYQEVTPPDAAQPFTRYKALRLDFKRPGDERAPHRAEIQVADPPFEWTYFP